MSTYYERNKEKIKEKQKRRYASDPLFREEHKKKVVNYNKRRAQEKKELKSKLPPNYKKAWKKFNINGVITECCRIGYLGKTIGRSSQTIVKWEREGKFPKTIIYNKIRYYTKAHYDLIRLTFTKYNSKEAGYNLELFFREVFEKWNKKINN